MFLQVISRTFVGGMWAAYIYMGGGGGLEPNKTKEANRPLPNFTLNVQRVQRFTCT